MTLETDRAEAAEQTGLSSALKVLLWTLLGSFALFVVFSAVWLLASPGS